MLPRQSSSTASVAGSSSSGSSSRKMNDRMIMKIGSPAVVVTSDAGGGSDSWCSGEVVFNVGDKVRVSVQTEEELKRLQEGHGGWNQRMARFIGKVGTIHRATENGDLRVKFEDSLIRWTFNPVALTKVPSFSVGDTVRVIDDMALVMSLQVNHGEWVDQMRHALGKKGKVVIVYRDSDLRVTMMEGTAGTTYTLNPCCVTLVSSASARVSSCPSILTSAPIATNAASADLVAQACDETPVPTSSSSSPHIRHHSHHHPVTSTSSTSSVLPTTTSSSSAILMPATRASAGGPDDVTDDVNRTNSTAEISDLLRQVQLRDTKFKCSRADGPVLNNGSGPHSDAGTSVCPDSHPQSHHHPHVHPQPQHGHHHAMHRSPAAGSPSSSRHPHASPVLTASHHHPHHPPLHHSSPGTGRPSVPLVGESVVGTAGDSAETVEMLKSKIAAIEDMITCNICMERVKNVAFLCGHGSCLVCAQSLVSCHMCRLPITARIHLY